MRELGPKSLGKRAAGIALGLLLAGVAAHGQQWRDAAWENQIAPNTLRTPRELTVVDPRATAERFAAVGERMPVVVRIDAEAADSALQRLHAAFRETRAAFRARLRSEFGGNQPTLRQINSSRFRALVEDFQAANSQFPVAPFLAQSWAKGYDGEPTIERLAAAVRDILAHYQVGDVETAESVWMVSLGASAVVDDWSEVAPHAQRVDSERILNAQEAGAQLRRRLDSPDRAAVGFMTALLRDTIAVDGYLTGLLLADRFSNRAEVRTIPAGSVVVRQGERIDRWDALALDSAERQGLRLAVVEPAVTPTVVAEANVEEEEASASSSVVVEPDAAAHDGSYAPGRVVALALAVLFVAGLIGGVWWLRRSNVKPPKWLIPAPRENSESMREALLPHLARELKGRLVQVLFAQRMALLENEAAATRRVEELEARLAKLQPAIAEKIRTYERRIRNLEQEIEEKDQETRDLLRAKLVLARKELDEEIARNRIELN